MPGPHDVPLVGPGHELQLTIDGRAVPHHEVVAERQARRERAEDEAGADDEDVAPGQTSLTGD